jgi:hypothetical protein
MEILVSSKVRSREEEGSALVKGRVKNFMEKGFSEALLTD